MLFRDIDLPHVHDHFQKRLAVSKLETRRVAKSFLDSQTEWPLVKALVKESASPGFKLSDVPEPRIREDEVLIRVRRAGVCGTDVHIYDWDAWAKGRCKPPFVVGHEFAGDVMQVGRLVTDVKEGDRVTAEGHIVDGRCLLCRTGNAHVCPYTKIIGVDRDGCFAEYIAMPATNVWHLDDAYQLRHRRNPRPDGQRVPHRADGGDSRRDGAHHGLRADRHFRRRRSAGPPAPRASSRRT